MKSLHFVLSLSLVAFLATFTIAAADSSDSAKATIQKAGAHTANVTVGSKTYTAPISFGEGASWDSVKDHYELAPSTASVIENGKVAISVEADGGISFRVIKSEPKAASKPAKKK
jgi:hypothetical protein